MKQAQVTEMVTHAAHLEREFRRGCWEESVPDDEVSPATCPAPSRQEDLAAVWLGLKAWSSQGSFVRIASAGRGIHGLQ